MISRTVWNGTAEEALELCEIVKRNCGCEAAPTRSTTRCAPHAMLLDQRALDGLLFVRRVVTQFISEEHDEVVVAGSSA